MKYVGVKTTGELRLHEVKEPQTDEIYMAVEDDKLGAVPIRPYEFVKWDGKQWVKVPDVQLVTTLDISAGTSQDNPLMNAASTERMINTMKPINANTLRFEFGRPYYNPQTAGVGSSGTWTKVNSPNLNVWDWTKTGTSFKEAFKNAFKDPANPVALIAAGDTSAITNMSYMFYNCTSLKSLVLFNTAAVANMSVAFGGCTSLKNVPLFDTSSNRTMAWMFDGCTSLEELPAFNTWQVTAINSMCHGCTSLKGIPLIDTSAVTNANYAFQDCRKVEQGSLDLYQSLSTKPTPVTQHGDVFLNCGIDTPTGAAELAQIPASWGGTAAG